jgi:hypothetical protein
MDEVSARAEMADAVDDSRLAVTVPRDEVERILATDEEVDLVLDVVRTNGERKERRIFLAWDREALRHLVDQGGEQIVVVIDPASLQQALDADVEAHGMREIGATLAVLVATAAGGAGMAQAYPAEGSTPAGGQDTTFVPFQSDFPTVSATVDTSLTAGAPGAPGALHAVEAAQAAAAAREAGMPRAMPSDYAAAGLGTPMTEGERAALVQQHRARIAADEQATPDIESIRAQSPTPQADIESIRAAQPPAPETGDGGGIAVDAPSAGVTAALAGGAALTIAAAAFALRRRREPEPAT